MALGAAGRGVAEVSRTEDLEDLETILQGLKRELPPGVVQTAEGPRFLVVGRREDFPADRFPPSQYLVLEPVRVPPGLGTIRRR